MPANFSEASSYYLLVTSERRLEGEGDRNGTPADLVLDVTSYWLLPNGDSNENVTGTACPPIS